MKKSNFPQYFPIDKLSEFDFGDSDAFNDHFLFETFCYTDFINLARHNNRTILIGPKGSGKSALFKAFVENKLLPYRDNKNKTIIIGISDELKYIDIDRIINEKFGIYGYSEEFKYALLWDFYIAFRILMVLQKNYYGNFTDNLRKLASFFQHIDIPECSNLTIFLDKLKNINFEASITDGTKIFIKYDRQKEIPPQKKFDLHNIKIEINELLKQQQLYFWVMFDKIDDFLVREEYDIQRKLLQGLVITENSFASYSNIFIKIFLRNELYEKIDLSFIGYDKIIDREVKFIWKSHEIRKFISQRILYNLFKILNVKTLIFEIDENELNLKEDQITDLEKETTFLDKLRFDKWEGRKINISDYLAKIIITKMFPRNVYHYDNNKRERTIDVFSFIETHFNFAYDKPTPRVILQFSKLCINKSKAYYDNNKDEKCELDNNNEYPLIKRKCIKEAYAELTSNIWQQVINHDPHWRSHIEKFYNNKGNKVRFDYKYFKSLLKIDDEELYQLIAYFEHIGCLKCVAGSKSEIKERKYEIPLFLRAYRYYN